MKHIAGTAFVVALGLVATVQLAPALAGWSGAQDEREIADAPTRRYVKSDGKALRGTVVATDGTRVQIRISAGGGSGTGWYALDAFEDASQYELRRVITLDADISGQLGIAEFALEKGLIDKSRKQLSRTVLLAEDESLEIAPDIRPRALVLIEGLIVGMVDDGKTGAAKHAVSRMMTKRDSDLTDEEREGIMNALDSAVARHDEAEQQERRAKLDAKAAAKVEKKIAPIEKSIDDAAEIHRKAMLGSRRRGNARNETARAVRKYEKALKDLDKLIAASAGDRELTAELAALGQRATAGMFGALLTGASLDLTRGQFNRALEGVNRVLADDSVNKEALAMRARIEVAANEWGWWR